jgi:propanol-preferring alcohol dehydrogenase
MLADSRYCIPFERTLEAVHAAPLLCAGLIGYRALRMTGAARRIGIYGFGSAAHLVTQLALHEGREIFAFATPGDEAAADFARSVGARWAGGSDQPAPERLDAALVFAPVGALVPKALRDLKKGGTVVCGGIHMSDIPAFPYADLWGERQIRSVANLTRSDAAGFLRAAGAAGIVARVRRYPLIAANDALDDLRAGAITGTAVLECP